MIKIEHTVTASPEQMEFIIEGMRNPMNSWDKSDSMNCKNDIFLLGDNDYDLMKRLAKAGSDDRKFMRQMPVFVRITAPLYWWKEFDTYKVGTVANSCSTMHEIHAKKFTLDDFSYEHLVDVMEEAIPYDADALIIFNNKTILNTIIAALNSARDLYNTYDKKLKRDDLTTAERKHATAQRKKFWWQMIQMLPTSYNQTRNVTMNYEVLKNMYRARKNHKLDEWHVFCDWVKTLPYSELITDEYRDAY